MVTIFLQIMISDIVHDPDTYNGRNNDDDDDDETNLHYTRTRDMQTMIGRMEEAVDRCAALVPMQHAASYDHILTNSLSDIFSSCQSADDARA